MFNKYLQHGTMNSYQGFFGELGGDIRKKFRSKREDGFTIVEMLVVIMVLAVVEVAIFLAFNTGLKAMRYAREKVDAVSLVNEKMEEIRNMPYDSLATVNGPIYPPGTIADNQSIKRNSATININIRIAYVDDPYDGNADGTIAGKPKDLYPYDYKKVEMTATLLGQSGVLAKLTSNVASKAAETPSNTGIIKLCVINKASSPVNGAAVTIQNPSASPPVNILTNVGTDGCIMVPNLPPDNQNHYHLTATKTGYSTDSTMPKTVQDPSPWAPDVNVMVQQVTNQILTIDQLATMTIDVMDSGGLPVASAGVHIEGSKLINTTPAIPKYSQNFSCDGSGHLAIPNMEFDDYKITVSGWIVMATSPYQPVDLAPGTTLGVRVTVTKSGSAPTITKLEPLSGKVGDTLTLTISGTNFAAGASVRIISATGSEIVGSNVSVSNKIIQVTFSLSGLAAGMWDLKVINPNGDSVLQKGGFEVKI